MYKTDTVAEKKPLHLRVNRALARRACSLKINVSQTLEQGPEELLQQEMARQWREENQAAVAAYNQRVAEHGVFSDGLRQF